MWLLYIYVKIYKYLPLIQIWYLVSNYSHGYWNLLFPPTHLQMIITFLWIDIIKRYSLIVITIIIIFNHYIKWCFLFCRMYISDLDPVGFVELIWHYPITEMTWILHSPERDFSINYFQCISNYVWLCNMK